VVAIAGRPQPTVAWRRAFSFWLYLDGRIGG
jgi:hypothetical protein